MAAVSATSGATPAAAQAHGAPEVFAPGSSEAYDTDRPAVDYSELNKYLLNIYEAERLLSRYQRGLEPGETYKALSELIEERMLGFSAQNWLHGKVQGWIDGVGYPTLRAVLDKVESLPFGLVNMLRMPFAADWLRAYEYALVQEGRLQRQGLVEQVLSGLFPTAASRGARGDKQGAAEGAALDALLMLLSVRALLPGGRALGAVPVNAGVRQLPGGRPGFPTVIDVEAIPVPPRLALPAAGQTGVPVGAGVPVEAGAGNLPVPVPQPQPLGAVGLPAVPNTPAAGWPPLRPWLPQLTTGMLGPRGPYFYPAPVGSAEPNWVPSGRPLDMAYLDAPNAEPAGPDPKGPRLADLHLNIPVGEVFASATLVERLQYTPPAIFKITAQLGELEAVCEGTGLSIYTWQPPSDPRPRDLLYHAQLSNDRSRVTAISVPTHRPLTVERLAQLIHAGAVRPDQLPLLGAAPKDAQLAAERAHRLDLLSRGDDLKIEPLENQPLNAVLTSVVPSVKPGQSGTLFGAEAFARTNGRASINALQTSSPADSARNNAVVVAVAKGPPAGDGAQRNGAGSVLRVGLMHLNGGSPPSDFDAFMAPFHELSAAQQNGARVRTEVYVFAGSADSDTAVSVLNRLDAIAAAGSSDTVLSYGRVMPARVRSSNPDARVLVDRHGQIYVNESFASQFDIRTGR